MLTFGRKNTMATQEDIQNKSDEELLKMYAQQIDYLPEVAKWTREEVASRHLSILDTPVATEDDRESQAERHELRSSRRFVRVWGALQILVGLFWMIITEVVFPKHPEIGMGIGCILIACGACLLKPFTWALAVGTVLYSVLFIWGLINLSFLSSVLGFVSWLLAGALALVFRHLWNNRAKLVELKKK